MTIAGEPSLTRLAPCTCPGCGYVCTAAGTTDGSAWTPTPGDVCGCLACGCPMVFILDPVDGVTLRLRTMTAAEADALEPDVRRELARVLFYATHVFRRHAERN